MVFVHCCIFLFAYRAVVIAENFNTVKVCCETVVTCVEPEKCHCLFWLFSHVGLMLCHCVLLESAMASWRNFSWVFCFISLLIVSALSVVRLLSSAILSAVACLDLQYILHYSINSTTFGYKWLNEKCVFWFSVQFCPKHFSLQKKFTKILS
jgi:hypothetical protein